MARTVIAVLIFFGALAHTGIAAEKTPVTFTSYSVQVLPAVAEDEFGLEWTLGLSSAGDDRQINSELMLATAPHGFTHETWFVMNNDIFLIEPMVFEALLDIPALEDANGNGIFDFFDPSMEVNAETSGIHPNEEGDPEEFTAIWTRGVGEVTGSVYFDMPYFGLTFGHQFYLVHYNGEYTYDRSGSTLQGNLALTNAANTEDRILGPLTVQVQSTNTLKLTATAWNNGSGTTFNVLTNWFEDLYATNFLADFLLEDGYPLNGVTDYLDWFMVISTGDANNNGILDLVDTGGGQPGVRPTLGITKTATGYQVTVTGTAGKSYRLESTSDVTATNWPNQHSVIMSGATGTATITADLTGDVFFRAVEI